jgi:16S rRNA (uracil1498-N3)-methyltransferase
MSRSDFTAPRLFVDTALAEGRRVPLDPAQANYLGNVLRAKPGETVLVFNGRDGEWRASLDRAGKRDLALGIGAQTRPQPATGDLNYLFAPLKHARLDYMIQKAVEMGATRLQPVMTRHTQVERVNPDRMRANAIEAVEQCGGLSIPGIDPPVRFDALMDGWKSDRTLVFCDEAADLADPVAALRSGPPGPYSVLIGPEGGFAAQERDRLLRLPRVVRLSLGPRILRADTAAVAALALVQAVVGDAGAKQVTG